MTDSSIVCLRLYISVKFLKEDSILLDMKDYYIHVFKKILFSLSQHRLSPFLRQMVYPLFLLRFVLAILYYS